MWQNVPQRAAQAIDRLMAHRLVSGADIVRWVFASPGFLSLTNQLQNGLAWEVLYNAVNKTLARTQVTFHFYSHYPLSPVLTPGIPASELVQRRLHSRSGGLVCWPARLRRGCSSSLPLLDLARFLFIYMVDTPQQEQGFVDVGCKRRAAVSTSGRCLQ